MLVKVEANQQIAAQAHALPAHEHHQVVVGKDQREHGEHEEVQVSEEAVVAALMAHVARAVNVDERADAGDEEQPHATQGVEQHSGANVEGRMTSAVEGIDLCAAAAAEPGV